MNTMVYLDYNATAPVSESEIQKMSALLKGKILANPSSPHAWGRSSHVCITQVRQRLAALLDCEVSEVIFTSGATESNQMGTRGVLQSLGTLSPVGRPHVVSGPLEHPSVAEALGVWASQGNGQGLTIVSPSDSWGQVTLDSVIAAITPQTVLVTLMAANNETGVVFPVKDFGDMLHDLRWKKRHPHLRPIDVDGRWHPDVTFEQLRQLHFHVDAVQALGKLPKEQWISKGMDSLSLSGHKLGAFPGTGVLILRRGRRFEPHMYGGAQEKNRRAGTENIFGIASWNLAFENLNAAGCWSNAEFLAQEIQRIRCFLEGYSFVTFNTPPSGALCNTLNFSVTGTQFLGEDVLMHMDMNGIFAASGSACSSGAHLPSKILLSMGKDKTQAKNAVRFSLGPNHSAHHTQRVIAVLRELFALSSTVT